MSRTIFCFRFLMIALLGVAAVGSLQAQFTLGANPAAVTLSAQTGSTTAVTTTVTISSSADSSGGGLNYAAFVSGGTSGSTVWLTLANGVTGTTPAAITVKADPTTLADGTYTASIQVYGTGATNSPLSIPVTFTVGQLGASPASLNFAYQTGGTIPTAQVVAVTGPPSPISFAATVSVTGSSLWLQVAPTSGTTPSMVNVSLNPAVVVGLAEGTYAGTLTLTPSSGSSTPLKVPVTLVVSATATVTASPASLTFLYQTGGSNDTTQQPLAISAPEGAASYTATATVNSGSVAWLSVSPTSGTTPATLIVTVTPGSLAAGTYAGRVTVSVPGAANLVVNVALTISSNPLISLSPASLTFNYQVGTTTPAAQNVTPASTGAAVAYTVSVTTTGGGNWLSATGGGTTPNTTAVSVNPTGLGAGTYSGAVILTAASAGNSPLQVPVTLTVTNNPLLEVSPISLTFLYQAGKTAPASQTVSLTSSISATLNYTVAASTTNGGSWLSVSPTSGSTSGTFNASVITAGLVAGTYTGSIKVTATNPSGVGVANSPVTIPVTYYVSGNPLIQASPAALSLTAPIAGTANVAVQLTSTGDALNYTIASTTTTGGPWLDVSTSPGATPGTLEVLAVALNLGAGTYSGTITITATNPGGEAVVNSPLVIPVTFQVVVGTLSATPTSLSFTQVVGGAAPASQTISVTGTTALTFTAASSNTSGVNWLSVTPGLGNTPATLTVTANGSNLSQGTYLGTVSILSPGAAGSPVVIPVTLTVTATPIISLTPAVLNFSYQVGGAAPASQAVQVAASSGTLAFTAAASATGGSANWLTVSPASGSTPATLTAGIAPSGLTAGTYTGKITVTSAAAGNSPQTLTVTLVVSPAATPLPTVVVSAASGAPGPVAPGEIVSIFGTNFGPAAGVVGTISRNSLSTEVAGVQVLFDNNPAPLLWVSATQINAIVPFELNGLFQTHVTIVNNGTASAVLDVSVQAAQPALFTTTETGSGQAAILNSDGSVNSARNPAAKGSVIVLYATGGGETAPPGVTGNITPANGTGLKKVLATVTVGGLDAQVQYSGSAPAFVEGALQINVQMSDNVPSGPQPVVITVDGFSSPAGVTVAVE